MIKKQNAIQTKFDKMMKKEKTDSKEKELQTEENKIAKKRKA
jgi:hypothetical protein